MATSLSMCPSKGIEIIKIIPDPSLYLLPSSAPLIPQIPFFTA